jgi:hypothetical protein
MRILALFNMAHIQYIVSVQVQVVQLMETVVLELVLGIFVQ